MLEEYLGENRARITVASTKEKSMWEVGCHLKLVALEITWNDALVWDSKQMILG